MRWVTYFLQINVFIPSLIFHLSSIFMSRHGFSLYFAFPGHFMGKKSVVDTPLLPSAQAADAQEEPAAQSSPGELFQEFLRVALRAKLDTQDTRSKNEVSLRPVTPGRAGKGEVKVDLLGLWFQEADLLMKILESYIQSRK